MAKKLTEETKAQIKEAIRHPVVWWKGAELPEEKIHPWEGGIQFLAEGFKDIMITFTWLRDRLYLGMGEGKIPPNWKSVHDVIRITSDGLTNPPMGMYMDHKRFPEKVHRWVMRFNATLSPLLIFIQCVNFGLTPLQRVVMWTIVSMFADLMSTTNAVSESKIWAGITPYSAQRGLLQLWRTLGGQLGYAVGGIPTVLMGLRDVLGITDYQIMIYGALIFAPVTLFARWLPSFAKQRVDFSTKLKGEGEETEDKEGEANGEEKLSLRETFAVVKHNRWFMMFVVVNLIRIFVPKTDDMHLYRFLPVPKLPFRFRGEELGGEMLFAFKNFVGGIPTLLLSPFALQAVKFFGGNVNFIKAHVLTVMGWHASSYFIGYKSWPRLVWMWFMESITLVMDKWSSVPHNMISFEMFDYVEWKTGYRSEGLTKSVDGIMNKLIKNNLSSVFGNAVTQWTGYQGWDIPVERQPERFIKSIWPLMHVGVFFGEVVTLIALLWFRYPHDPREVEADLIERRALAQKLKEEAAIE